MGTTGKIENAIDNRIRKAKKTAKRIACCTFWWLFLGIAFVIGAIALLVNYAKYWNESTNSKRYGGYVGVGMLFLGIIMTAVGVALCVLLWKYYNKLTGKHPAKLFKPPSYPPGEAPYPQQPEWSPQTTQSEQPNAPLAPGAPAAEPNDVHVDITPHDKY